MITFVRVDDRVIHGQIMTRWFAERTCDRIIIVDDFLAKNPIMGQIYKNVVPTGMKVGIYTKEDAIAKIQEAKNAPGHYFVIFKTALGLSHVVAAGGAFVEEVNVGPASKRPDAVEIVPTIALTEQEIEAYDRVLEKGVRIYFQIVPDAKKVWWEDARKGIKR